MFKKIILSEVSLFLCLGFFAGCGSDYVYNEADLKLTVEIDKTDMSVGDVIKATIKLENLSGKDIRTQMSHTDYKKLEDMFLCDLFEENTEQRFYVTSKGGPRIKITLKKDSTITRTVELIAAESGSYEIVSVATFCAGKKFSDYITIKSNVLKLTIE